MARRPKCPRCDGFLFWENDLYGSYWNCIACGYVGEPDAISREELAEEEARFAGKQHRVAPRFEGTPM